MPYREPEPCGPDCRATPRTPGCSDRFCGATDCSTCYGPGWEHDDCPEPEHEEDEDEEDEESLHPSPACECCECWPDGNV